MATSRPPGGGSTPQARLGIDLSSFQRAPAVAREAGRATAREISNAFKSLQAEQRLAQTQAQQTLAVLRAQQAQITATTRAESSVRTTAARAEAQAAQQTARVAANAAIEEQRRITATHRSELRAREQAARASQAQAGAFGRGVSTFAGAALGGIGGPVGAVVGGLAGGSLPLAAGLAVSAGARAAVEASQIATAYDRQRVAAVNLAGSQSRLNQLLTVYERATGGAIDRTQSLADVTKLMSVGFADNTQELDQTARAIRGISIAMGTSQDTVTQNLILELFSQRGQRLDQLGLQYDKVRQRAEELRVADTNLTQQMAYQQAVLEQANERFGKLADSAEGGATELERLRVTWSNLRLEMGQELKPNVEEASNALNDFLNLLIKVRQENQNLRQDAVSRRALEEGRLDPSGPAFSRTSIGRVAPEAFGGGADAGLEIERQRTDLKVEFEQRRNAIERDANNAILDATRQFGQQRASTIANYEKQIAREAEDFGRQRANAERKHQLAILDVAQDSARQRVKWEEELARNIAKAQADSAERVTEVRGDSAKRLAEVEKDYARSREKAEREHGRTLREAAANLDAVAVREEQRRFREERQEAKSAHEEQKNDLQAQLQERLDDEAEALDKSIRQQQDAHARRLAEQAENDRLRIEEMKAAFEAQKEQEDIERGIRLGRQAEDHNDQLIEMGIQQGERIAQIERQAQDERDKWEEEFQKALDAVGIRTKAYEEKVMAYEKAATDSFDRWWKHLNDTLAAAANFGPQPLNPMITPGGWPSLVPPVLPTGASTSSSRSVSIGDVSVTVLGSTNMSPTELHDVIYGAIADVMDDAA